MNGELRVFPELGYVVVSLSNLDPPAASGWWSSSPSGCRTSSRAPPEHSTAVARLKRA